MNRQSNDSLGMKYGIFSLEEADDAAPGSSDFPVAYSSGQGTHLGRSPRRGPEGPPLAHGVGGYRHPVVMKNPTMAMPNPITMFHPPIVGIGNSVREM